jgi:hypothetical protein
MIPFEALLPWGVILGVSNDFYGGDRSLLADVMNV